jgi:hypothetical protein
LVSLLSVDAVEIILSDAIFCIESEEALFELILGLGPDYFPLRGHLRWHRLTGSLPPALAKAASFAREDVL